MTHRALQSSTRAERTLPPARGEQPLPRSTYTRRRLVAMGAVLTSALVISALAKGNENTPISTEAKMDAMITTELNKGPEKADIVLNDGRAFTVGPSNTVANAMIRMDQRAAAPSQESDILDALPVKATTASVQNIDPEGLALPEDEVVMWQDDELSREYGRAVLLAMPAEQLER